MICGIDVYHEQKQNLVSALGFCASYNKTCTKYWSSHKILESYGSELCT